VRDNRTGERRRLDASQLFIFIGATPSAEFAGEAVARDDKGFVKTGEALGAGDLASAGWTEERRPFLLETSCPRVFAVGDIRSGSVKRVASAVGEGSVCVTFIHELLQ
ncbi:MAG: hypothetical protein MI723_00460, partial [Caulobacterales bacterium]|nr:hypothetical protein [Caulobacterales bacterium]